MDLVISSDKIGNPLLVELLRKLTESFGRMGREFYVIGATARDVIMSQRLEINSMRKTKDLDIAIAIPDWEAFDQITSGLVADGFTKSKRMHQRFFYGGYELDVVPYGPVAKEDDNIYWPPEEDVAMSVKGFNEVLSDAVVVSIDGEFDVKFTPLHGLFLLKFAAWLDRGEMTSKDAEDMSFILSNYFMANIEREVHPEVYDREVFDEYVAGAYWLAYDLVTLLSKDQLSFYKDRVEDELAKEEASKLVNQILDNTYGLKYETVKDSWQVIADVFGMSINEE
mgnify:CR=1 FL=1